MHQLINELRQYHKDKARHLSNLQRFVNQSSDYTLRDDFPQSIKGLLEPFEDSAESSHHHNEETILAELRITSAPIHSRVDAIAGDHEALTRLTVEISRQISNPPVSRSELSARIINFVDIYCDHANGEENIFFPMAEQFLTEPNWARIRKEWQ